MELAYGLYMAEAEGLLLNKRKENIELVISDLRNLKMNGLNPNKYINAILLMHDLTLEELTDAEARYIEQEVDG